MTVTTSNARHVLFRLTDPARLPDALLGTLRDEVVLAGWMRASGILHDVRIRALGGTSVRGVAGSVQVVALEGSIGLSQGDVTCGLRAVLARETDTGLETIAGEIVEARVGALEVLVTAFDDVTATRQAGVAGVWLLDPSTQRAPHAGACGLPRPRCTPPAAAAPSARARRGHARALPRPRLRLLRLRRLPRLPRPGKRAETRGAEALADVQRSGRDARASGSAEGRRRRADLSRRR
ncbi:MAG: hypothetical protein KF795_24680 [Labilithrix sp.]|nr:hypothetical protein [Labilithrix sp.]